MQQPGHAGFSLCISFLYFSMLSQFSCTVNIISQEFCTFLLTSQEYTDKILLQGGVNMSIGSRIKEARNTIGLTQEELAMKIGVTKGAIANYENEVSTPKIELMYRLFSALHCDANYLYQDEMSPIRGFHFSLSEQTHIKKYRALDEHGQKNVDLILNSEYDRCTKNEPIVLRDVKPEPTVPRGFRAIPTPDVETKAAHINTGQSQPTQEQVDAAEALAEKLRQKNEH